jgi:hypothetical protein
MAAVLFSCPLSEWDHGILHNNRLSLRLKEKIFYWTDGGSLLMAALAPTFIKQYHEGTHSEWTALEVTLALHFYALKLSNINKTVCEKCSLCARHNSRQGLRCKHLLVFVCTFSE